MILVFKVYEIVVTLPRNRSPETLDKHKGVCTKLWTKFKKVRIGQILAILAILKQTGMEMDAEHLQECAVSET